MSTLLKQVAEPQEQSIPPHVRFPWCYDTCSFCGQIKTRKALACVKCIGPIRAKDRVQLRHEVTQPDDESIRLLALTKGKETIVDADQLTKITQIDWFAMKSKYGTFYAISHSLSINGERIVMPLPNFILGLPAGVIVDHKNGNSLDNRVDNFRRATHAQNIWNRKKHKGNTSGYIGVSFSKRRQKWFGALKANGKLFITKFSTDIIEVAKARDCLAILHHGEFASLNFPDQSNSNF